MLIASVTYCFGHVHQPGKLVQSNRDKLWRRVVKNKGIGPHANANVALFPDGSCRRDAWLQLVHDVTNRRMDNPTQRSPLIKHDVLLRAHGNRDIKSYWRPTRSLTLFEARYYANEYRIYSYFLSSLNSANLNLIKAWQKALICLFLYFLKLVYSNIIYCLF